jgi:hypothetical protein
MGRRNPEKVALTREVDSLTEQLRAMESDVLQETGIRSAQSLNGLYGGKYADYIDMRSAIIPSADHFVSLYLEGFVRTAEAAAADSAHRQNLGLLRRSPRLKEYLYIFLTRTYLRNIDALSKLRPKAEDAAVWIGQNNANYGLLVTPFFNEYAAQWANDGSEIRHFQPLYWSVGHILHTGLLVPGKNERIMFGTVEEYLNFFLNVLVRNSGSRYEYEIAQMYRDYVLGAANPSLVPLLIPEFRFEGLAAAHEYRLDFTVIDPVTLTKMGFELSPWSTHGYLSKIKGLSQAKINEMARDNFEREMRKHKEFFRRHGVHALIYTDTDLADLPRVFDDIRRCLEPRARATQVRFSIIHDILDAGPDRGL